MTYNRQLDLDSLDAQQAIAEAYRDALHQACAALRPHQERILAETDYSREIEFATDYLTDVLISVDVALSELRQAAARIEERAA